MKKITAPEWRDAGIIIVLILILFGLTRHSILYYKVACGILLLLLTPAIWFKPPNQK